MLKDVLFLDDERDKSGTADVEEQYILYFGKWKRRARFRRHKTRLHRPSKKTRL